MQLPFFHELTEAKTILIAGAGGGFDLVSGIPLYLHLRRMGKRVVLANLSFTCLPFAESAELVPGGFLVTREAADLPYFPEKYLLDWLAGRDEYPALYAFSHRLGGAPLAEAYAFVQQRHEIDAVILVDGGTDSLMFGDEAQVGTIVEDACSIAAVMQLGLARSYVAALGFGVEHDLNHHACLQNIATLTKARRYLGAISLTATMTEGAAYLELVDYLNRAMPMHQSIVTNSIASAIRGEFGDFHATQRTRNSVQFISPLMNLFWFCSLQGLAQHMPFLPAFAKTQTMREAAEIYQDYRRSVSQRPAAKISLG